MPALPIPVASMTARESESTPLLDVSVVMPCLDERATIGGCISKALNAIRELGLPGEVIVGDNGSTDGSQEIASASGARVVSIQTRGYGAALLGAIAASRGQIILMGDSDDSHDFAQLERFLNKLNEGYDLVVGNRFRGGIQPGAMPFLHRYVGNPVLSGIGRFIYRSPVHDFHCGLRAFRRAKVEQLHLKMPGMEFASEMIVKATLGGLRIAEIATSQSVSGRLRGSNVRTWSDGWRHLSFLLKASPQSFRRKS